MAKVTAAGGKVLGPKTTIPGVGYHAYCQDTEGNVFGILQTDMSAK
jgi:predicted enzyme related to lactoylglutathione lyase